MSRIAKYRSLISFRITFYFLIHLVLLATFGWMAMGRVGLVIAFWVVLLWFSAWQRPLRLEFFFIAAIGIISAATMLPPALWDNIPWLFGFLLIAASPLIDFFIPMFRGNN
ncbi:MAG: hypothetical protein WCI02_18440 [Planctomycetota bacterium]|jgi:hypothetical protein